MREHQKKKLRIALEVVFAVIALAIAGYLLFKHTPKILKLLERGDVSAIEAYIKAAGERGRFLLILLQILETVTIVLPAMPVYICAGAVYGKVQGILMCYLTNLVMNLLIFSVASKMKTSLSEFSKFQKNPKLEALMQTANHPERLVMLMCLLPIVPNGMIPYISAQTKIGLPRFMGALAIGCLPGIALYVCFGDLLLSEHFKLTLPVVLVVAAVVLILMVFKKRITAALEPKIQKMI